MFERVRERLAGPFTPAPDDAPPDEQIQTVLGAMAHTRRRSGGWDRGDTSAEIASAGLRRRLPWTEATLIDLLDELIALATHGSGVRRELRAGEEPVHAVLRVVEQTLDGAPARGALAKRLRKVRAMLGRPHHVGAESRKAIRRIDQLLGEADVAAVLASDEDPWAQALLAHAAALESGASVLARRMLSLAATASQARPTKAFTAQRDGLVAEHGAGPVGDVAGGLLEAALAAKGTGWHEAPPSETGDALRGLAWIAAGASGEAAGRGLAALAVAGFKKVPDVGPLCAKAATAALNGLAEMPDGAGQLARVRAQLRRASAAKAADAAIERAAERLQIDRAEFEERVVPDFGLDATGVRRTAIGDHAAELRLLDGLTTELRFTTPAGRTLKSAPAALREAHPEEIAALRRTARDVKAMAAAQRLRLERLLLDDRTWTAEQWRARYRDHGLVGVLARRLIWVIDGPDGPASVLPGADGLLDHRGRPVPDPPDGALVRLWHPAAAGAEEVRAWRELLEEREVRQPFKQAHREIYLLTEAERRTATYSNRFAAHVLRQHQMAALAQGRGWRYSLLGDFDSGEDQAVLDLPAHGLSAAFWVERPWDTEQSGTGVFTHVLSDQVRFEDAGGRPVELESLPPRLFSEVMRDVDLLVGVTSIGNDPTWADGGGDRRLREYWAGYALAELGEQATVRRDLLERLLPRLSLAGVAEIDGRFLRVRGRLRTYKVHLGSGNVLMEPNDEFLCIVPGRGGKAGPDQVFLPFEGDQALAVILSKALLLARDDRIEDPTITSQIGASRR